MLGPDPSVAEAVDAGKAETTRDTEPLELSHAPAAADVAEEREAWGDPIFVRAGSVEQTGVRVAGLAGIVGAVVVLASLPAAVAPQPTSVGYVIPVVLMSAG